MPPSPSLCRALCTSQLLTATLAGCGSGDLADTFAVRDSAGVSVAESTAAAWESGEGWRVTAEPVLDIGAVEGEPAYQLFNVRGATRLSDGRIVVADGGSSTLRWYDARGRFLFERGGEGGGPDEFQRLRAASFLRLGGDTVAVVADERVARFDGAGERSDVLPEGLDRMNATACLADGTWVALGSAGWSIEETMVSGEARDSFPLILLRPGATALDTLGRFPGAFRSLNIERAGGEVVSMTIRGAAFAGGTRLTANGSELLVGPADAHVLYGFAPEGILRRIVRWVGPDLTITEEDRAAWVERMIAARAAAPGNPLRDDPAALRRSVEATAFPPTRPAYEALRAGPTGHLWVQLDAEPGAERERHLVFEPDGRLLGTLTLPERFRTLDVGADYVLGVWRDQLDVEHVRLYMLEKS